MYFIDFFKRITRKSNIPVLIYLVLNIFVIAFVLQILFGGFASDGFPFWKALLTGLVLYAVSLLIALSPVGEWILRLQTGCKKIRKADQMILIRPIFQEVYEKARRLDPTISPDVQLFISDDESPNAFATGRKTVCVTEGMLHMPQNQIKATLAHEFGHLAHKDTDLILVVSVGNMIVNAAILGIRLIIDLFHLLFSVVAFIFGGTEGAIASIVNSLYHLAITAVIAGLTRLWTWFGTVLVMKSSRGNELEADAFSFRLGYGSDLCALLNTIGNEKPKGLFASLASSHPDKTVRISNLQRLGASGSPTYHA